MGFEQQLAGHRDQIAHLKEVQGQLRRELEERQEEVAALLAENERLAREKALSQGASDLERENERLRKSMRGLKSQHNREIGNLKERIDELTLLVQRVEGIHPGVEEAGSLGSGSERAESGINTFMAKLEEELEFRENEIRRLREEYMSEHKSEPSSEVEWEGE